MLKKNPSERSGFKSNIVGYHDKQYFSANRGNWYFATPIPKPPKRIMPPEKAIPLLISMGWHFSSQGSLLPPNEGVSGIIKPKYFSLFGDKLENLSNYEISKFPYYLTEEV